MKFSTFVYSISCLLLLAFMVLLAFYFNPISSTISYAISSPLPSFLTRITNPQVTSIDIWLPKKDSSPDLLDLTAKSALSYDLTTNTVLYNRNATSTLPMASLTKIMTAIIALEHPRQDDTYKVSAEDLVGEDSMGLSSGESLHLSDLLYGLILHSGNDAAETLASNFPGGRQAFIGAMNEKIKALGLSHTHFTNPTGLEGDGNQYTTAYDLLVMTRYALSNFPIFAQVSATFDETIPSNSLHKEYLLENETNLISSYPGVKGVKTGYTPEAGLCLVTYLDYSGHKIIAVLLGSENRRLEMKDLLDYSLKKEGIKPPAHT